MFALISYGYAGSLESINNKYPNFLILSEPVQLDPIDTKLSVNAHTKLLFPLIFESLIRMEANQLVPVLASSWVVASNNKSIEFTVDKNHFFSDGAEVTAHDVVNSVFRLCSPNSEATEEMQSIVGCEEFHQGKNQYPQVKILNKYQVRFYIKGSPNAFLYQLTSSNAGITENKSNAILGSGPYMIEERNDNYIALKKNPYYVKKEVKNNGIVLVHLNDKETIAMLQKHLLDGALMYRIQNLQNFSDPNYSVIKGDPNIAEILIFNNQKYPFNIPAVRSALAADVYNNINFECVAGAEKAYGIVPYGTGGSIDNMPAKHLTEISPRQLFKIVPDLKIKKANVIFHQLENFKNDCESQQIVSIAKKYNIDVTFQFHKDYSSYWSSTLSHRLDGFIESYFFKNKDAYTVLQFFSESGENNANLKGNNIDKMLKAATAAPSPHSRFVIYKSIGKYILDKNIVIPLFYTRHISIINKCLIGASNNFLFNPYLDLPQITKNNDCKIS